MTEIIAIRHRLNALASYDEERDIILYDAHLDEFPELKRKTLEHELDHVKNCQGKIRFLPNLKRELIDYPKTYFDDDFYKFLVFRKNHGKKRHENGETIMKMVIYQLIVYAYSAFLNVALLPIYVWKYRKALKNYKVVKK
jgi:hypothetical protein